MAGITLPSRTGSGAGRRRRGIQLPGVDDVQQVRQTDDPGVRVPQGAFGGSDLSVAGAGIGSFADSMRVASEKAKKEAERQQREFEATKSTEALLAFEDETSKEYQRRQTEDDPSRPGFMPDFEADLGKRSEAAIAKLPPEVSEEARQRLRLRLTDTSQGYVRSAGALSVQAGEGKALTAIEKQINTRSAQAARDPDLVEALLTVLEGDLEPFAGALRPGAEEKAHGTGRSSIILSSVAGFVEQNRYGDAEAMLASGKYDADLNPADRDRAMADIKRGKAVAVAEIRDLAADHFASIAETGQGIPGLGARAGAIMDPTQIADFQAREGRARKVFSVGQSITFAPPAEVAAQIDRLKPAPGSPRYADESRLYEQIAGHAQRMMQKRIDNPAAYALQEPSVARAFKAAEQDPTVLPAAIGRSLAVQEAMGIPAEARRILPNAAGDVARIAAMKPEEAADAIEGMAGQYGKYWGPAYKEMVAAKLPPEYVALSTLDGPDDVITRKALGDAIKVGRADLVASLPQSMPKADLDKSVAAAMEPWERVEITRGTVKNVATMRNAAELLAYRYAVEGRSNPAEDAVKALVMDRYDILDSDRFGLYVPKGMASAVEDTGMATLGRLTADMLPDPGGDPKLTPEQRKAIYLRQARNGRFILNGDGTAAFLVDPLGQPVVAAGDVSAIAINGMPVVSFRLSDAKVDAPVEPPDMGVSP